MSNFIEEAFFSSYIIEKSKILHQQNAEWFELCESINKFSLGITSKIVCHRNSRSECLVAALFLRVISTFEATIILINSCITIESQILIRALMESLFALRAITLNENIAEEYYQYNLKIKKQALEHLLKSPSGVDKSKLPEIYKSVKELETQIELRKIKNVSVKYLAEKGDLLDYYYTAYTKLSWTVHSNILDVGQTHMVGKSDNYIDSIHLSIQIDDVDTPFLTALECLVIALRSVNNFFKTNVESDIKAYENQYKTLYNSKRLSTISP